MEDVGAGLKAMRDAQDGLRTGLIPSSVDVVFSIAASDKKGGELTVDLSKAVTGDVTREKSTYSGLSSEVQSSWDNIITIHFINVMALPKETVGYTRSPDEIKGLFQALLDGPQS